MKKWFAVLLVIWLGTSFPPRLIAQENLTAAQYTEDFDVLWNELAASYAYFDKKQTDWNKVRKVYRPLAAKITNRREFVSFLERVLEELYDFHCTLNTNTADSAVLVPTNADLWAEWQHGHAMITEVRPDTPASRNKIKAGMQVVSINGTAVQQAVSSRIGQCLRRRDQDAANWALRTLLAGRHNEKRQIKVRSGKIVTVLTLPIDDAPRKDRSLLEYRLLGNRHDLGYIRLHNSLGDNALIPEFDRALAALKNTKGLILDLRDTPSGGNTTVARAIMGRFIKREMFYQKHSVPAEERASGVKRSWIEIVSPRGSFCYANPVVVLADHWTGSMGEGITIGMDAMKRARVVGTPMAGLLGATEEVTLPNTHIGVHYPAQKLFHVNGQPRENFVPAIQVDFTIRRESRPADPILAAGLSLLRRTASADRGK